MAVDLPFEAAAQSGKVTDLVGDNGLRYRSRKMRIDDSIPEAELADSPNNIRSCFQVNIDVRNRSSLEVQALQCHSMIHIELHQEIRTGRGHLVRHSFRVGVGTSAEVHEIHEPGKIALNRLRLA